MHSNSRLRSGYDYPVVRARLEDRGLTDLDIQRRGTKPKPGEPHRLTLGLRWVVEATNTWWSNYGQLRRSTDRRERHRHAALRLATAGGFSLHAGIATRADQRTKLERLCRYVARSAVANSRLSLTRQGQIRYSLKTPWRDGTTHVVFDPLDFIADRSRR